MEDLLKELYYIVQDKLGFTEEDIKSQDKPTELVDARRIFAMVLVKNTRMKLEKIGEAIGRDHSSICHYKKTTEGIIETDEAFRKTFNYINMKFKILTDGRSLQEKLSDLIDERMKINEEIQMTKEEMLIMS